MDRDQLADFLRRRREALQPEDVGLSRGPRRRTRGLRREEVASLAHMSTDYYTRLEQARGPQPSESMLGAIARALRLSRDERDHILRLADHTPPPRRRRTDHVSPALMRVLDRLDTPAQVMSDLGETLAQNPAAIALLGNQTKFEGDDRSMIYRWFTDPQERNIYQAEDQDEHARTYVAGLRLAHSGNTDERAQELVSKLLEESDEFSEIWARHEVGGRDPDKPKRLVHPELGQIVVNYQILVSEHDSQALLVYTATPGTPDHDKLELLSVIGSQNLGS